MDWLGNGTDAGFDRRITYNAKGQILTDQTISKRKTTPNGTTYDTYDNTATNAYGSGSGYALGSVTGITSVNLKNGNNNDAPDTSMTNTYSWYDGATLSATSFKPDVSQSTTNTSTYTFTPSGSLLSVSIADGRPRTVTFKNDLEGRVIRRDESDNIGTQGDPHGVWYRFGGREIATTNNVFDDRDLSYDKSINRRTEALPSATYTFNGGGIHDHDLSYERINSFTQGSSRSQYVVRGEFQALTLAAARLSLSRLAVEGFRLGRAVTE